MFSCLLNITCHTSQDARRACIHIYARIVKLNWSSIDIKKQIKMPGAESLGELEKGLSWSETLSFDFTGIYTKQNERAQYNIWIIGKRVQFICQQSQMHFGSKKEGINKERTSHKSNIYFISKQKKTDLKQFKNN